MLALNSTQIGDLNLMMLLLMNQQKFIQLSSPIDVSIAEYIPTKEIPNIKLARIQQGNTHYLYALCSLHTSHIKYNHIIYLKPFTNRSYAKNLLIADYVKSRLSLHSLNRRIIIHNSKYYLMQDAYEKVIDSSLLTKNALNQTVYKQPSKSFYLEHIVKYQDNEPMLIKLLQYFIYLRMIGCCFIHEYTIIIHNEGIYGLDDSANLKYPSIFLFPMPTRETDNIYQTIITRFWRKIRSIIKRYYKIISNDKVLPINTRIIMLYQLKQLRDRSTWKFYDIRYYKNRRNKFTNNEWNRESIC